MSRPVPPEWRFPLRAWQRDAFERWSATRPADALFVATPGAGKTRFAARIAHAALRARDVARTIVVVPREHLKGQVARAMAGAGIELDHRFRNADEALPADLDGAVVTYQQVAAAPARFAALCRLPTLAVLDEVHHAGEEASWGAALRTAFGPARHRVAMSGTPFRSDGAAIPFVRYAAGECVADYSYDYAAALGDGVCRALVFPLQGGEAHWTSRDGNELRASFDDPLERRLAGERLRTALTQPAWLGDVLEKAHRRLLDVRAAGHADAGGLVAAMSQDHARFVAAELARRTGTTPELVVSDLDDASRRIARFASSRAPWIVAVHMISEGVDIPRLRVGVFASNVVSELYFRQFCGRFVRTGSDPRSEREAYVYLPDDVRLRALASRIAVDVRRALKARPDDDEAGDARRAAERPERASDALGAYESLAATARDGRTLDYGPLFDPAARLAMPPDAGAVGAAGVAVAARARGESVPEAEPEAPVITHAEKRETLRRELRALVAKASQAFGVDHKQVHATLNGRFGGSVGTATVAALEARRKLVALWLERRSYDGMR